MMELQTIVLLLGTFTGVATSAVLIFKARAERKKLTNESGKISADAAQVISNSAVALLAPMQEQITHLEARLSAANKQILDLDRQLQTTTQDLRDTNRQLNIAMDRVEELEGIVERTRQRNKENPE
jgi:peptidoglycan hydrolase CwlO-like protein